MSEKLQEPGTEEALPELSPSVDSETTHPPPQETTPQDAPPPIAPAISWLRLAYSFHFLLAVLAVLTLWSEVGGQGHLDLMPWYTKLACVMAAAWCSLRLTAALVEERIGWSRRTRIWLAGLILVATAMAAITYFYHLHEEPDQSDSDETSASVMTGHSLRAVRISAE